MKMATGRMCIKGGKEETKIQQWTGLFQNDLKSEQHSLVFVKRMMAVAVSSITYLRGIFPEDAYRSRYVEDQCLKLLREDCSNPGACKVVKWMMGCFDALDKKYLQMVFICVYTNPEDCNCIIESYQLKFKYTQKGPEMDMLRNNDVEFSLENTKKASVLLIRKLFLLLQNLSALPSNIHITMKLYYYDDITPADYEPPGFKQGECDKLWFEGTPVHFRVGDVQTAFHTFRVRVSAEQGRVEKLQGQNEQVSLTVSPSRERVQAGPKGLHTKRYDENELPSENESEQFKKPKRPLVKRNASSKAKKKRRV